VSIISKNVVAIRKFLFPRALATKPRAPHTADIILTAISRIPKLEFITLSLHPSNMPT
jgi:hypothetical protein